MLTNSVLFFVIVVVLLLGVATAQRASNTVLYPTATPISFYNSSFPYGVRSLISFDGAWNFQFDTRGKSYVRGIIQTLVDASTLDERGPYFRSGGCQNGFLGDDGANHSDFTYLPPSACGNTLIQCLGMQPDDRIELKTAECPDCAPYRFPQYFAQWNTAYFECYFPYIVLSVDTPPAFAPLYSYGVWQGNYYSNVSHPFSYFWGGTSGSTTLQRALPDINATHKSTGLPFLLTGFVPAAADFDERYHLQTGPSTSNTTVCTVPSDVGSFFTRILAENEVVKGYHLNCDIHLLLGWTRIAQGGRICLNDPNCRGYITKMVNGTEVFDCFLFTTTSGVNNDIAVPYKRMLHLRPINKTNTQCVTSATYTGYLDVFVETLSVLGGRMDVYVNGLWTTSCVASSTVCNSFLLCATVAVQPGSIVRVVNTFPSGTVACGRYARTVFTLNSIDASAVALALPSYNPSPALTNSVNSEYRYRRLVSMSTLTPTRALMFTQGLSSVVMSVQQTGFNCPSCTTPMLQLSFYNEPAPLTDTNYSCGGILPFAGGAAGLSDACATDYLCTDSVLNKITPAPGYLWLSGAFSTIYASTSSPSCRPLTLTIAAKPDLSASPTTATLGTFPLLIGEDSQYYRTFINDKQKRGASALQATAFVNLDSAPVLLPLHGVAAVTDADLYYVDWRTVTLDQLSPTMSQRCIVDFVLKGNAYCVFRIPQQATQVVIYVEDANLKSTSIALSLQGSTTGMPAIGKSCGSTFGFANGDTASNDRCGTYLRCWNTSLRDTAGQLSYTSIRLTVPQSVASRQPCLHSLNIRADFDDSVSAADSLTLSQNNATCRLSGGVFCRAYPVGPYFKCVPSSSICDGINDCPYDLLDEGPCSYFVPTTTNALPASTFAPNATVFAGALDSEIACRKTSMARSSDVFAFNGSYCFVFDPTAASAFIAAPSTIPRDEFTTYAFLTQRGTFGNCSDAFTCLNRGTAYPVNGSLDRCACSCRAPYSGASCHLEGATSLNNQIIVTLDLPSGVPSPSLLETIRFAVQNTVPVVQVAACSVLHQSSPAGTAYFTICSLAVAATQEQLDSAAVLRPTIFIFLGETALNIPVTYSFVRDPTIDVLPCSAAPSSAGAIACTLPFFQQQALLLVEIGTLVPVTIPVVTALVRDVTTTSTGRRRSTAPYLLALNCTTTTEALASACWMQSCYIDLSNATFEILQVNASYGVPGNASATIASPNICLSPLIASLPVTASALPSATTPHSIQNSMSKSRGFLAGFVLLLISGTLFLLLGCFFRQSSDADLNAALRSELESNSEGMTELTRLIRSTMIHRGYFLTREEYSKRASGGLILVILALNVLVVGFFLVVLWHGSATRRSNVVVLAERYADNRCEASLLSPVPQDMMLFPADTATQCTPRQRIVSAVYTVSSAWCEDDPNYAGQQLVHWRAADGASSCLESPFQSSPSNVCVSADGLWGGMSGFTVFRCATLESAEARFAFAQPAAISDADVFPSVVNPIPAVLLSNFTTLSPDNTYHHVAISQGAVVPFSSFDDFRTATFSGNADTTQLSMGSDLSFLVQFENELFGLPPSATPHILSDALSVSDYGQSLPSSNTGVACNYAPVMAELPVGFQPKFNSTWLASAAATTVLHGVAGTPFDIGTQYSPLDAATGEEGFTISFMMRATTNDRGFVVAVMDNYQCAGAVSPLLTRLERLIQLGGEASQWTSAYNVYASVYVDGPSQKLYFAATSGNVSTPGSRLGIASWDLTALAGRRLFNGAWHSVVLVVQKRNSVQVIRLVLDGETSASAQGWNQCFANPVEPISPRQPGDFAPIKDQSCTVFSGGAMSLYHASSGVANVEFFSRRLSLNDILARSSKAVQVHSQLPRIKYLALGAVMISLGALTCAVVVVGGVYRALIQQTRETHSELVVSFFSYVFLIRNRLKDDSGTLFEPLRFRALLRWLNLSTGQTTLFLEDLERQFGGDMVQQELFRILMISKGHSGKEALSADLWNQLRQEDEEQQVQVTNEYSSKPSFLQWLDRRTGREPDLEDPYSISDFLGDADAASAVVSDVVAAATKVDLPSLHTPLTLTPSLMQTPSKVIVADNVATDLKKHKKAIQDDKGQRDTRRATRTTTNVNIFDDHQQTKVTSDKVATKELDGAPDPRGIADAASYAVSWTADLSFELAMLTSPLVHVVQLMFAWMSNLEVATKYLVWFHSLYALISIDPFQLFPNVSPLVTPIVQLFAGLIIFSFILYYVTMDEYAFAWYVARYVMKRDAVDHSPEGGCGAAAGFEVSLAEMGQQRSISRFERGIQRIGTLFESMLSHLFSEEDDPQSPAAAAKKKNLQHLQHVNSADLHRSSAVTIHTPPQVDVFSTLDSFKIADVVNYKSGTLDEEGEHNEATITTDQGQLKLRVPAKYLFWNAFSFGSRLSELQVFDAAAASPAPELPKLEVLGHCCHLHPHRSLTPQVQTDVWPFEHAPCCCVRQKGVLCGVARGAIYICGESFFDDESQTMKVCSFAVCERHFRGGVVQSLWSDLVGTVRRFQSRGWAYVIAFLLIVLANSTYLPIVKTAMMILGCNPTYQCVFPRCYDPEDTMYIVSAYLCCVIVTFVGIGLPLLLTVQMYRRQRLLKTIFFAPEYEGSYEDADDENENEGEDAKLLHKPDAGTDTTELSIVELPTINFPAVDPSNASLSLDARGKRLQRREWNRFLASDPTVLGSLYRNLKFEALYFSPILLAWKVLLLLPVIFIPVNTFEQLVGIAAVEFGYAAFLLITRPFISTIVDIIYLLGAAHQLLLIGMQSLNVVQLREKTGDLGGYMVAVSLTYLVMGITCMGWTVAGSVIARKFNRYQAAKALGKLGVVYSGNLPLIVALPALTAGVREADVDPEVARELARQVEQPRNAAEVVAFPEVAQEQDARNPLVAVER